MLPPIVGRGAPARRFDVARARLDPARRAAFLRDRPLIAGKLLGRTTPYDLKTPWLTLRPDHPIEADKGWLEYTSPSSVGMGQFDDGQRLFAAFDLIFSKQDPDEYAIERPAVAIRLLNPPAATMIVEVDVSAYDFPPGDPKFEVQSTGQQFVTIAEGQRDTMMFLMHDFLSLQSAWADGTDFAKKSGNWAFFEARISAVS